MSNKLPSLKSLARMMNLLDDTNLVIEVLRQETTESKHLEWKYDPPVGPGVTTRAKYRWVKAAISFANWEGGFIVFGVDPKGRWAGLTDDQLSNVDPSNLTQLLNGCVSPDIPTLNYVEINKANKKFIIVHLPPSDSVPHVTTKQVSDRKDNDRIILAKYAVYCRQGAKSDLATPNQHQKIIDAKVEALRRRILSTVKEVPVAVFGGGQGRKATSEVRAVRLTDDPSAPAVRLTRSEADSGIFMHESLHDGLFNEINNVVDATLLLSPGMPEFHFDESVYYRVYAERQYVENDLSKVVMLAETGLTKFYGPHLYWLSRLTAEEFANLMMTSAAAPCYPAIMGLIRLVTLLGQTMSDWLYKMLEKRFKRNPQPPNYYWSFRKIRNRAGSFDNRVRALRTTNAAHIDMLDGSSTTIAALLESPETAASYLSNSCIAVFKGKKELKTTCRILDTLAYGGIIMEKADEIQSVILTES